MNAKFVKKFAAARKTTATALIFIFFLVISIVFVMPTVLTFTNSLMSKSEIAANYGQIFSSDAKVFVSTQTNLKLIPDMVTFDQYENVLIKNPQYLIKFWNSVILTVPIVVGQILVALLAAYGFARFEGKIRSLIFFVYVILMLMPYQVTLVPNRLVAEWLNLYDTRWAIILPGIFSPFAVFILTKFMRRIPNAMIEAARRGRDAGLLQDLRADVQGHYLFGRHPRLHRLLEHGRAAARAAEDFGYAPALGLPLGDQLGRRGAGVCGGKHLHGHTAAHLPIQ